MCFLFSSSAFSVCVVLTGANTSTVKLVFQCITNQAFGWSCTIGTVTIGKTHGKRQIKDRRTYNPHCVSAVNNGPQLIKLVKYCERTKFAPTIPHFCRIVMSLY